MDAPPPAAPTFSTGRYARLIACAVGLALMAGAAWGVARDPAVAHRLLQGIPTWPWWAVPLLAALPCLNWLLTSAAFYTLTRPRSPISWQEMTALIGSAWVLNFFPLSPGLFGRVVYQRALHGLSVRTNARIIAESIALGWAAVGVLLPLLLLVGRAPGHTSDIPLAILPLVIITSALLAGAGKSPRFGPLGTAWAITLALKVADVATWTARYHLVFHLAGTHLTWVQSLAVAVVAQTAMLVPLIGNGLGIREWAVGLLGALLPAAAASTAAGLGADLINRAGELLAAIPVGLFCAAWLARLHRARKSPDLAGGRSPIKTHPDGALQADPQSGRTRTE
ncbi:MAG: hypothetical protein WC718_06480 [Phycisphaerales bacterium]|jgi:hypothetical protein